MNLSERQRAALLVGLGLIALMGLFPQTACFRLSSAGGSLTERFYPSWRVSSEETTCQFILAARDGPIRISRLVVQWGTVSLVTVGVILMFDQRTARLGKHRRGVLWAATAVTVFMGLWPPWTPGGYQFVINSTTNQIDMTQLMLQLAVVVVIAGAALILFRSDALIHQDPDSPHTPK